jgi:hypothetical protein
MATSEEKGLIEETNGPGAPNLRTYNIRNNNALHVDWVRTLINNWHHAYDMTTQARVCWVAVDGARPTQTFTAADTYYHMHSSGDFPWAIRHDRAFMRPVFRLAGAVDNAAYTLTFKLCLAFAGDGVDHQTAIASSEISVATTTEEWRVAPTTYLSPTANVQAGLQQLQTLSVAAGVPVTSDAMMCRLDVFVKSDNTSATAYLSGLYLREYIGT